jgi:hypothetical protein
MPNLIESLIRGGYTMKRRAILVTVLIVLTACATGRVEETQPGSATIQAAAEPTMTLRPTPTTFGGGGGQIAFDTSRSGNLEIYLMLFDGNNEQ